MNKNFFIFGVFILGFALGFGASYFTGSREALYPLKDGIVQEVNDTTSLYKNTKQKFSLQYPKELIVQEFDEGSDTTTTVFQKPGENVGFQIFITPYKETEITEERLAVDIPSGIIDNPQEVIIGDSLRAFIFFSESNLIGETREVWFLHGGYLFEVTTQKTNDEWISEILSTLRFE